MRRKLFVLIGLCLLLITGLNSVHASESIFENYKGFLYNSFTGEKIADIEINDFVRNNDYLEFTIDGEKQIKLSSKFVDTTEMEGESLEVFNGDNDIYNFKAVSTDDYILGIFELKDISLQQKFNSDLNNFSVFINLNPKVQVDSNSYLNEYNKQNKD